LHVQSESELKINQFNRDPLIKTQRKFENLLAFFKQIYK